MLTVQSWVMMLQGVSARIDSSKAVFAAVNETSFSPLFRLADPLGSVRIDTSVDQEPASHEFIFFKTATDPLIYAIVMRDCDDKRLMAGWVAGSSFFFNGVTITRYHPSVPRRIREDILAPLLA